jgi:2-polyprenyl-3-methyl-5-hydroxy-6-metoxy-1,4-benzoquinol methylase
VWRTRVSLSGVQGEASNERWTGSAGVKTLQRMARVDRYNDWVARVLRPYRGRRILVVGCGIGNMTPYLLDAERVTCIDVLPASVAHARQQFGRLPHVTTLLADISADGALAQIGEGCSDTAVCISVLEHIEDDAAALRSMLAALQPGGHLLLFAPAGRQSLVCIARRPTA